MAQGCRLGSQPSLQGQHRSRCARQHGDQGVGHDHEAGDVRIGFGQSVPVVLAEEAWATLRPCEVDLPPPADAAVALIVRIQGLDDRRSVLLRPMR